MQANKLCPAPHLEAADLNGQEVEVTIAKVGFAQVGAEQVEKGVIYFAEFDRGFVVNRTNIKRIIAWHGNETDAWIGKKLMLYESEAEFNGQTVPCIRVRQKK